MKDAFIFLGLAAVLAVGPTKFWHHKRDGAAKECRCECGLLFADKPDFPAFPVGTTQKHSYWFGSHVVVCFVSAPNTLRELQEQADKNRWKREGNR